MPGQLTTYGKVYRPVFEWIRDNESGHESILFHCAGQFRSTASIFPSHRRLNVTMSGTHAYLCS